MNILGSNLPGEDALYRWFRSLLDAAASDPELRALLDEVAVATERDIVPRIFHWSNVGVPVGNGWTSPWNGAEFGTDYYSRIPARGRDPRRPLGPATDRSHRPMT